MNRIEYWIFCPKDIPDEYYLILLTSSARIANLFQDFLRAGLWSSPWTRSNYDGLVIPLNLNGNDGLIISKNLFLMVTVLYRNLKTCMKQFLCGTRLAFNTALRSNFFSGGNESANLHGIAVQNCR